MAVSEMNLSGSTNGRGIKIAATATPGTLLHTAHATNLDELWLWIVNSDTTDRKVTIEAGGVSSPDDLIEKTIPAESGLKLVIPGIKYTGSVAIRAFGATANVLMAHGYVNRIS